MPPSIQNNFIKGIAFGIGGIGLRTILNIALIPLIIHQLGVEQYGFYIFLLSFLELLIMIDLGLNTGLLNRLTVYISQKDIKNTREHLSIGYWLYGSMALLMFGVGYFVLPSLTGLFNLSPQLQALAQPSYLLILITGSFCLFGNYFQSIIIAHHEYHTIQIADFLYLALANIMAAALLLMGFGIVEILCSRLIIILIRTLYLVVCAYRLEPTALLPSKKPQLSAAKELFSVSIYSLLLGISGILAARIDNMIIAAHLTMVDVAIFGIVFRLFGMVSEVIDKISLGIMPIMTKSYSLKDEVKTRFIFLRSTSFINFISSCLLVWVVFYYDSLFTYFSHGEIPIQQTYTLMWVALVTVWSRCIVRPASTYLFVFNHRVLQVTASVVATIINVILSVILVQSMGIVGVALGTTIPMLLEHHVVLVLMSCKNLGISAGEFIKETYLKLLLPIMICILMLWGLKIQPYSLGNLYLDMFGAGAIAFSCSGLIWFMVAASSYERNVIVDKLKKLLGLSIFQKSLVVPNE